MLSGSYSEGGCYQALLILKYSNIRIYPSPISTHWDTRSVYKSVTALRKAGLMLFSPSSSSGKCSSVRR